MSPDIQIKFRDIQSKRIMQLEGKLTSLADNDINQSINELFNNGIYTIIMDFSAISYINSAGLAVLIGILADLKNRDGRLIVFGLTPHFKKLFKLVGLSRFLEIFDSEEAAIAEAR